METPQLTRVDGVEQVADQSITVPAPRPWADPAVALGVVRREAWLLPSLRGIRHVGRVPETWEGVSLRLQAALWEVAARSDIPVTPGSSIDAVARLLVGYGAIIPPAGDAVRALAAVVEAGCAGDASAGADVAEVARLGERLSGYLLLRARFG